MKTISDEARDSARADFKWSIVRIHILCLILWQLSKLFVIYVVE